jgi:hypothetical protein
MAVSMMTSGVDGRGNHDGCRAWGIADGRGARDGEARDYLLFHRLLAAKHVHHIGRVIDNVLNAAGGDAVAQIDVDGLALSRRPRRC